MENQLLGAKNVYNYDELIEILKIDNNPINRSYVKTIINSLIKNNDAAITKQMIYVDKDKVIYLWELLQRLSEFFDYRYNTRIELSKFLYFVLNDKVINLNAIFCPGYTEYGYKNYIGNNNTIRLKTLKRLKDKLENEGINSNFKITLSDIFLENIDIDKNMQLYDELSIHREEFIKKAKEDFRENEIVILSEIFNEERYISGFIDNSLLYGKTYQNFYKNNESFYKKMGWGIEETKQRNDKLFTIYSIISEYINNQDNGVYLPMETMYSRSKVMTKNNVCTMYLHK